MNLHHERCQSLDELILFHGVHGPVVFAFVLVLVLALALVLALLAIHHGSGADQPDC